jgi:tetratricopeptide (TPR) repeat protein
VPHHTHHVSHHSHPNAGVHHPAALAHHAYNRGGWHGRHDGWHGWHHGYWGGWGGWPSLWLGGAAGWLGSSYYYNNPYYVGSSGTSTYLNYSQPIVAAQTSTLDPTATASTNNQAGVANNQASPPTAEQQQALAAMDSARAAFKRGDYAAAQKQAEQAISLMPDDPALHEFRALTLFAQRKYKEAAAGIYAVLATGPGWDEQTVRSLYGDPNAYTSQVKALQDYVQQNPKAADALFLLAYHQLTAGKRDLARQELDRVVELQPDDQLAAQLAKALAMPSAAKPAAGSKPA